MGRKQKSEGRSTPAQANFQKILENSFEHIVLTDKTGKLLYSNGRVEAILGYSPEEYAALDLASLVHPDDKASVARFYEQVNQFPNQRQTIILRIRHRAGHYVWTEIHATNLLDDVQIQGILFQMSDASARIEIKDALRRYGTRMNILHQLDLNIISGASIPEMIYAALEGLRELIPCDNAHAGTYDAQREEAHVFVRHTEQNLKNPPSIYAMPKTWVDSFPPEGYRLVNDIHQLEPLPPMYAYGKANGARAYLHILLKNRDEVIGIYNLVSSTPNFFTNEHVEIAVEVANQLAIAMAQRVAAEEKEAQAKLLEQQVKMLEAADAALIESEKRYRRVVEDQTDLVCRYDADCRLTFVNQAYASLFGASPEELVGTVFLERIPENEREDALAYLRSLTTEYPISSYEHRAILPDGGVRWHQWTDRAIFDEHGKLLEYQGVGRDITERKRAEEAEENERRFRDALLGALTALSTPTDVDSMMNRILLHAAEVVACDAGSIILFEDSYGYVAYSRGFSDEVQQFFASTKIPVESSLLKLAHNGGYIISDTAVESEWKQIQGTDWIRSSMGTAIIVSGQTIGLLSSDSAIPNYFDESHLVKLEAFALYVGIALERVFYVQRLESEVAKRTAELNQTTQELESILDNSYEAILLLADDLSIVRLNPAYRDLMQLGGFAPSALKLSDAVVPEDRAKLRDFVSQLTTNHNSGTIELLMLRSDGSQFEAELGLGYVAGKQQRFVATVHNITESKNLERQLRYHASLQQNVRDAVIVTDMDFVIQGWNKAAESTYGYTEEEVVGKASAAILKTEFGTREDRAYYLNELRNQGAVTGEFIQRHKDGHNLHIYASTTIIKDTHGNPFAVISINRDISERKKMEMALNSKLEEELEFQHQLKSLHEINIELSKIQDVDEFYKQAVILGRERLGFERLGLLLYDEVREMALGTYGTDEHGNLSDERTLAIRTDSLTGILARVIRHQERFIYEEDVALYTNSVYVGQGWNAVAGLWGGEKPIGWLTADNALKHGKARKVLLDILALYAASLGANLNQRRTAIALYESEERYHFLIDTMTDMVVRMDTDSTYLYVSSASRFLLGYEPHELLGKKAMDFIVPEDVPKLETSIEAGMKQKKDFIPAPVRFMHKDGYPIWLEITGRTVLSDSGDVLGFIASARDISERMAIEGALRESEERFRLFMEEAPIAVVVTNKDGRIVLLNTQAEELLGYQRYEIIGKQIEILVPDARRRDHQAKRSAYSEKPHKRTMGNVKELFARRKDGGLFWADIQLSYIEMGDDLLVMSFIQDISERKLAEESLRMYANEVEDLYNKAPCGYHSLDGNGLIVAVNDTELAWLGYEREEVLGKIYFPDIVTSDSLPTFRENFLHFKQVGYLKDVEFELIRNDGTTFFVSISATAVYDEHNNFVMSRSTLFDISERKQAQRLLEQALEKEKELGELKTRFVSMASHEFRTPLAVIKSSTDLVLRYGSKQGMDWSKEKLLKVSEQIGYLTNIMNDVLNLGRLQSGKTEFKPSIGDLAALCRKILDEFRTRPDVSHVFVDEIDDSIPEMSFDPSLMRQLMGNLLSNAVKYSHDDKPIGLRLQREDDIVVLEVIDRGIGIPEADLGRLFEPFHRAANVGAIQGTGMGLSITKEIAEKHGGTIEAQSILGQGTKMIVRLPLKHS